MSDILRDLRFVGLVKYMKGISSSSFFLIIIFLQLVTDVAVLFNVRFARQILGFIYLVFVPGWTILKALGYARVRAHTNARKT